MPGTLRPGTSPLDQGYQLHVCCVRPEEEDKTEDKFSSSPHVSSLDGVKPSIFSREPTWSRLTLRFSSHPLLRPGKPFCTRVVRTHLHGVVVSCEFYSFYTLALSLVPVVQLVVMSKKTMIHNQVLGVVMVTDMATL